MSPTPSVLTFVPRNDTEVAKPATRISQQAFFIALLTLYLVALASAFIRTFARWYHYRKLGASDYFLLFAVLTLTVGNAIPLAIRGKLYGAFASADVSSTSTSPKDQAGNGNPGGPTTLWGPVGSIYVIVGQTMTWATMYSIKGGFMMFFRNLIRRVRSLEIYWSIILSIVALAFIATLSLSILVGVYLQKNLSGLDGGEVNRLQPIYIGVTISLDAVTDILIVSIPVRMLWNLQVKKLTKAVMGGILSLSFVMVGIAVIRGSLAVFPISAGRLTSAQNGMPVNFSDRMTWLVFWQLVEADASVLMLSLTIVRAFMYEPWRTRRGGIRIGGGEAGGERDRSDTPAPIPAADRTPYRENETNNDNPTQKSRKETDFGDSPTAMAAVTTSSAATDSNAAFTTSPLSLTVPAVPMSAVSEGWNRPKRSRSKLVRKNSEASSKISREPSRSSQKKVAAKKKRGLDAKVEIPTQDRRWPRSPRLPTPKLGSPLNIRPQLERSASSQRLINPSSASPSADPAGGDYFGHVAMVDFEAVWAAPPPNLGLSKKKSRERNLAAAMGVEDTGVVMRTAVEREEREQQEEAARCEQERQEEQQWLKRYYDDERIVLPPPVQRPKKPVRVVQMDALHQPDETPATEEKQDCTMPGGMF